MLMTTACHCAGIGPLDRGACAYAVGDARSAQCYFRKRAALAEALRRVQGVSATARCSEMQAEISLRPCS